MAERENAIASGKAKIWRSGWIADYPDAENFLALFYTGRVKHNSSSMNSFNFHNATFDQIYEHLLQASAISNELLGQSGHTRMRGCLNQGRRSTIILLLLSRWVHRVWHVHWAALV